MYIHAFDPTHFLSCWNLRIQPLIFSPNCAALLDPGLAAEHVPINDTDLRELEQGAFRCSLTPRAQVFVRGALLLHHGSIEDGHGRQIPLSDAEREWYICTYSVELEMEKVRRVIAPGAPSRLACLWFAADSPQAQQMLEGMFPNQGRRIIRVQPDYVQTQFIGDASLYEAFYASRDLELAQQYWSGHVREGKFEHLLDGSLRIMDQRELALLISDCVQCGTIPPTQFDGR